MTPYRELDKEAQQRAKQEEEKQKKRAELSMFGVRQRPDGEWVPVLERVETNQCKDCRGFGTHGNPLCGAVYNCKRCQGTEYDPDPETVPKPKRSVWQRIKNWWK